MKDSLGLVVISLLLAVTKLSAATLYVGPGGFSTIQQAVDAAAAGDRIVVTNGVYNSGGRTSPTGDDGSRVVVDKPVTLLSVNGPQFTIIQGDKVYAWDPSGHGIRIVGPRCVSLCDGASLSGFTLANGMAYSGGGVRCTSTNAFLTNCVIRDNSAPGSTANGNGGGAFMGTLYNCTLTGNSAAYLGGGACHGKLYNCTLTDNSAAASYGMGGGAYGSRLYNCILHNNTAGTQGMLSNYDPSCTLNYTWTGNQGFVAYPGNLRLRSNSPCINAGNNAYATTSTDLDGRPRIVGGTVDIGAYEFQPGVSGAFIVWLQRYDLPTDGSADFADADADGMNNWQEWVCGTSPIDPLSVLRMLSAAPAGTNVTVSWQSVFGVNYSLERSTNLASLFTFAATNIPGLAGTITYTDTNAAGAGLFFYRVGVNQP